MRKSEISHLCLSIIVSILCMRPASTLFACCQSCHPLFQDVDFVANVLVVSA